VTKKNWHEVTCERCEKVVPRTQNNQRYCSTECQQASYKPRLKKKKCKVCNDRFETRNDSVTCSKFCAIVYNTANRQKYTDKELIHLALLNKGYGFTRFCLKLGIDEKVLMGLREYHQEETKIDLFGILQDPDGLVIMRKDEWIAKGKPPKPIGGGQRGTVRRKNAGGRSRRYTEKEMLETYRRYEQSGFEFDNHDRRTQLRVKVFPEFNWGPYKPRKQKKSRK